MFSIKKVQKSLNKTLQRATVFLSSVGPSPTKSFRAAILSGDEEKAIEIYQQETNGSSLQYDLHVSLPFPIKAYEDQTPMHLASLKALESLILLFLEHNGNPNAINSNYETCLHSLCQESNQDIKRCKILNIFLEWRGCNELGEEEFISINRVDNDGNTPLHYASKNGLMECILCLTANNAIISIVNKDQMTCCEIAEANNHIQMADILEIALIFPPPDQDVVIYDDDESRRYHQQVSKIKPFFLCDSQTYPFETLEQWRGNCIECAKDALTLPKTYIEVILDHFNWDLEQTLEEMLIKKDEILEQLHLSLDNYKPVTYVLKSSNSSQTKQQQQQQQQEKQSFEDIADLDDIFVDVGVQNNTEKNVIYTSLNEINSKLPLESSQNIIHVNDNNEIIGSCSICGEDMYPIFNSNDLLDKSLPYHGQREIRCPAGHNFCSSCWAQHWTVQINDNSAAFLHCMGFKCGEILSSNEWAKPVLGETLTEKLKTNRLRRIVDSSSKFRWCPAKDCNSVLCINSINDFSETKLSTELSTPEKSQPQYPQSAICGNGHSFCLSCNSESHAPCSCEHWISWTEKIQREMSEAEGAKSESGVVDVASALWVAANTKKCPRCQTPIEKNEGCNHMTCRKCRYEFCWICFQDWDKHSNRTGGYFQCTIYNGNTPNTNGPDDEVPRIDPDDDYGSAATEAYRAKERANLMDRFINHYTRYRAHSDSLVLELKMHSINLNRIRNSLHSSGIGSTPWLQGSSVNHPYLQSNDNNLKDSKISSELLKSHLPIKSSNEEFLCPEEELDLKLIYSGDWDEPKESPLLFLQRGFRELIKCRQILKGSFPLSFYMMPNDSADRRWNRFDYETAQRKAYAESRSKVFLEMQSELESLTETLSDVVARRRLRASANQIARATFAARSRRLDFEVVIKRHYEAYAQDKIAESKESQNKNRSSSRRRSAPRPGFRSPFYDDDDSTEASLQHLMESFRQLEYDVTSDVPPSSRRRPSRRQQDDDFDLLLRTQARSDRSGSRSNTTRDTPQRRIGGDDSAAFLNTPPQSSLTSSLSNNNDNNNNNNSNNNNNNRNNASSISTPPRSIREELLAAGWTEADIQNEGFDDNNDVPAVETRDTSRRTRRQVSNSDNSSRSATGAPDTSSNIRQSSSTPNRINDFDDEEDINRAILMSLQERQPMYTSVERPEPPSELVQLLTDMGFSRDISVQALKDYGENVEDAIMYLTTRG